MPTSPLIPCEFFLIRYVPDVVKGEFINIGVLLREASAPPASAAPCHLRFTRDWSRVRGLSPDANTVMLEAFEAEMLKRFGDEAPQPAVSDYPRRMLATLLDSTSNSVQISEPQPCLAENLLAKLEELAHLYVETLKERRPSRERTGRAAITAAMRSHFEKNGVWHLMRKRIPAARYTRPGDPMKLDCGYRPNGVIRIFHGVSLETDVEAAKSLAFSAPQLREGVRRVDSADLDLAAVIEPIRTVSRRSAGDEEEDGFADEAAELYRFGVETMESAGIRVLTVNNLAAAAATARVELRI